MTRYLTFGQCLKHLLSSLDINMNRLSKAINVDSSLVSRWVHEKRIPALGTCYIEAIADYLSKNISNKTQANLLNEILSVPCEIDSPREITKESIKKILLETQGYSIKLNKAAGNKIKKNVINLSSTTEYSIINGKDNILKSMLTLIEKAIGRKGKQGDKIYITYSSEFDSYFSTKEQLELYKQAISKALNRGWELHYLIKLSSDMDRTVNFISFILPFICTGQVHIYYFDKYDFFPDNRDFCVVTGIGALSSFPLLQGSELQSAFLFQNKEAVEIVEGYISLLMEKHSKRLLNHCLQDRNSEYLKAITEANEGFGDELNFNSNHYLLLLPECLYEKLLVKKSIPEAERKVLKSYYKRQKEALLNNLQNHSLKCIYYVETIDNLVKNKYIDVMGYYGSERIELADKDIIYFIENIIDFLKKHDNYHVAAIFQEKRKFTDVKDLNFIIKRRQGVFFNVAAPSNLKQEMRLAIEEPMVAMAFEKYFYSIWDRIAPIYKDKEEIIAWLQGCINLLKLKGINMAPVVKINAIS